MTIHVGRIGGGNIMETRARFAPFPEAASRRSNGTNAERVDRL
jgi:hypothetical protein